jgi:arylsulfate sulfotransferase
LKRIHVFYAAGLLAVCGMAPLHATVTIQSLTSSLASPQSLGSTVIWSAKATDSSSKDDLTFQFNVTPPNGTPAMVKDFNIGTLSAGTWTSLPFVWTTIAKEGLYTIQVVAKDFITGESATKSATFELNTRVSLGVVNVNKTGNALVALFSAPSCAAGSTMRVAFYTGTATPNYTNWAPCQPPVSMNFYVAGMLPLTTYSMYSQTSTGGKLTNSTTLTFTTEALPTSLPAGFLPSFTVNTPAPEDDPNPMLLWAFTKLIVPVATDLNGNINWYYGNGAGTLLTRPVPGSATMLTIQNGESWDSSNTTQQLLREIDLAGNTIHETNTGVIANQLVAMGAQDATPCGKITEPLKSGDACLNDFHHDAIRYEIGSQQYTAFMAHIEKLFPAGTQGHAGTALVDVLSEMVIVLNSSWQVVWYYDAFNQLDITRTAPLGETCSAGTSDCPTNLFLSTSANDWTHANTVDYVAASSTQNPDSGDFLVSMRDQDQVIRINYNQGAGSCAPPPAASCIGWYMGPPDGYPVLSNSFTITNPTGDPWPWFSHQHDVTYANSGLPLTIDGPTGPLTGPLLTIFDNGNTRYSAPPLGLGSNCGPSDCNSRGMALIVDEATFTAKPVLLQDLKVKTTALGGAGLLSNNNYFFATGINTAVPTEGIEILPTKGEATGTVIMNVQGSSYSYRGWQMPNLYTPPDL